MEVFVSSDLVLTPIVANKKRILTTSPGYINYVFALTQKPTEDFELYNRTGCAVALFKAWWREVAMSVRVAIAFFLLLLVPQANAKNKKKQALPDYVLKAQTVAVVIRPDAGEPLTSPQANRIAQESVKNAMSKWGRFMVVTDTQNADLIVAVRKGHASGTTVVNSPADRQPPEQPIGGVPDAAQ